MKKFYLFTLALLLTTTFSFAQNVGIGTAAPASKLHVQTTTAADGIRIDATAANGDPIMQYRVNGTARITMGVDDSDGDRFKIGTTAITTNTRMTIQTNGYIGVGTTTPSWHWHQTANRAGDYIGWVENTSGTGSSLMGYATGTFNGLGGGTNNTAGLASYGIHLPATGAGWGFYGTSNSSDAIGVRGAVPTAGSWLGYGGYFSGGLAYANGLYNISDRRMKKDITDLSGALDKITSLRGVTFKYNIDQYEKYFGQDTRTYVGFVAQEVEAVVPEAVADKYITSNGGDKDSSFDMNNVDREVIKVVDYVSIVPLLVEAIKEQQQEIETLKAEVQALKGN